MFNKQFFKLYGIALVVFLAIDMVWLLVISKDLYAKELGYLMAPTVNLVSALIFYLLFIVGLVVFVIQPALTSKSIKDLVTKAVLFGLVTYATYDLTNLATIKNWPLLITVIDLIWGMTVSTIVSVATFKISEKLKI
jgi:uncharacterized membrane protein